MYSNQSRNGPPQQPEPKAVKRKPNRGQTMVEFALTLPMLLALLFGVVEFGRIFQAWVTLQNAARAAARYTVTGQYDISDFPDIDKPDWTPVSSSYKLAGGVACPYTPPSPSLSFFRQHWGIDCDPKLDEDQWLRKDI